MLQVDVSQFTAKPRVDDDVAALQIAVNLDVTSVQKVETLRHEAKKKNLL